MMTGIHAKVEDRVLVKEAESVLTNEGVHSKLAHEHWTGLWEVTGIILPRLSFNAMKGCRT